MSKKDFEFLRGCPQVKKALFCNALIYARYLGFEYDPDARMFRYRDGTKNGQNAFWKNAIHPDSSGHNHNWNRISRVLEDLTRGGLHELAGALCCALDMKIDNEKLTAKFSQLQGARDRWHKALVCIARPQEVKGEADFETVSALIFG